MKKAGPFTAFLAVLTALTVLYWSGLKSVPFHPDESTRIYMAADTALLFRQPGALGWSEERAGDARQRYRVLDAPVSSHLIGLARMITGQPELAADWDWGKTWEENARAGALPPPGLLLAARAAMALWYPFSVLLLYLTGRRAGGEITGWAGALLMALSPLVMLHTRRAMAEGPLVFTLVLTLWWVIKAEKRPWLTAVPAALAFCSKQTLGALAPVGLLAILWQPAFSWQFLRSEPKRVVRLAGQMVVYGMLYVAIIFALNPVFWSHTPQAISAAVQERQSLAERQSADRPGQALDSTAKKLVGLIGSLYLTPPIFSETGNYVDDTRSAEQAYLANPVNNLYASLAVRGIFLTLGLIGFAYACAAAGGAAVRKALRREERAAPTARNLRDLGLLLAATFLMAVALLVTIPLPWQRYYMPLVPFTALWAGYGLQRIVDGLRQAAGRSKKAARSQAS